MTDQPETDQPETDQPETDQPETDQPETDQPETDQPETDTLEPQEVDQEPEVVPETEGPLVTEPLKLVRIASMVQTMLVEVRGIDLDENAVKRLEDVHRRTVASLRDIMSDDLRDELDQVVLPLRAGVSEAEVRVAQAQLAGWLEGLFHGIRASLWGQQVAVQKVAMQNLEALQALEAKEGSSPEDSPGLYL